jgi:aminopeptidase
MKTIYQKYAELLVNYSLKIKKNDRLLIESTYLAEPLIKEVYREALKLGAFPEVKISVNGLDKIYYDTASEEQFKDISPLSRLTTEKFDARLHIRAPFNLKSLQSVDAEKKKLASESQKELHDIFMQRAAEGSLRWNLCQFPVDAAAQESGMSLEEYQDFVYNACHLYADDPIKEWQSVHDFQEKIVEYLNNKTKIQFKGKDIDISFSTKGRIWINSDGTCNMPSGEVFTTPVEDSVNGKIRFSYPGIYMGQEIEDIYLEVKDGEIVKWTAKKGQELLDSLMEIPGARRFGEAAVGTNMGIQKFTRNMLYDEKIGGTIHMAVGACYPETGGKNNSSIHWDMLADMKDGGEIYADDELIYQNGEFVI